MHVFRLYIAKSFISFLPPLHLKLPLVPHYMYKMTSQEFLAHNNVCAAAAGRHRAQRTRDGILDDDEGPVADPDRSMFTTST